MISTKPLTKIGSTGLSYQDLALLSGGKGAESGPYRSYSSTRRHVPLFGLIDGAEQRFRRFDQPGSGYSPMN